MAISELEKLPNPKADHLDIINTLDEGDFPLIENKQEFANIKDAIGNSLISFSGSKLAANLGEGGRRAYVTGVVELTCAIGNYLEWRLNGRPITCFLERSVGGYDYSECIKEPPLPKADQIIKDQFDELVNRLSRYPGVDPRYVPQSVRRVVLRAFVELSQFSLSQVPVAARTSTFKIS